MSYVPPSSNPKSHEDDDYRMLSKDEYKLHITESERIVNSEWVGYEDLIDFREFTIDNPGSIFFNVSNLTNKISLTVYSKNTNGSLKKLTSLTTKTAKETKNLLLDPGTYYLKVEFKGSKNPPGTEYNIGVIADIFTKRNNEDDSFKNGALPPEYTISVAESKSLIEKDWVGYGDIIDARRLNMTSPGRYRFFLSDITNKVRLTVYSVSLGKKGEEKLKKMTSITTSANKIKGTKELQMLTGEYYITVEALDWKKGKNTDYSVHVDGATYDKANNTDDTWNAPGVKTFTIGGSIERFVSNEWVGFGDFVDWFRIETVTPGYYNFNLQELQQKTKLTVYTITEAGKKKSLGSITVTPGKTNVGMLKKSLLLDRGVYYIAVESVDGKKGKNTDYSIGSIAGTLFPKADSGINNQISTATEFFVTEGGVKDEWVGFGDPVDYFFFVVPEDASGKYTFRFDAVAGMANMKISVSNGKTHKTLDTLKAGETSVLDFNRLKITAGSRIYLEIASADHGAGKKNTDYNVFITPQNSVAGVSAVSIDLGVPDAFGGNEKSFMTLA